MATKRPKRSKIIGGREGQTLNLELRTLNFERRDSQAKRWGQENEGARQENFAQENSAPRKTLKTRKLPVQNFPV
jgi:hypothetical protein